MAAAQPCNILWILSDQHHAGCMGVSGHPDVRTPRLDDLAARGTRFTRAYCNNPICGPSRCSMISGLYPRTTGITGNAIHRLDLPNPGTLPTVLRRLGYQTALIGKGHMIGAWDREGFEHVRYCDLIDSAGGDPLTVHYFRHLVDHGLGDEYDLGSRLKGEPGYAMEQFVSRIPLRHCVETWTGDEAVEFLRRRDRARPFMMQLSFQRPHEPLGIPPECVGWYDAPRLALPASAADYFERRFAGKPAYQQQYVRSGVMGYPYRPRDAMDLRRQLAAYYTLVTLIDHQIGRVIDELRSAGQWENTVVLYAADHGDFAGDHGLALKNLGIYESIHRTPFILRTPNGPTGVRDDIVELVDIYPTLMEAAGLAGHVPGHVEGRSLLSAVGRKAHTICEWDFLPPQDRVLAIRDERYRLVFYPTLPDAGELYDAARDPGELDNRWDDASLAGERRRLTESLLRGVSGWRRAWSFHDDLRAARSAQPSPAVRLQQRGEKWSAVSGSLPSPPPPR